MKEHVGILNVGAGDTKLSFDKNNPKERARAAKIVAEMIKQGFSILVQVGEKDGEPLYQRARAFDPETCEYIIAGGPDEVVDIGLAKSGEDIDGTGKAVEKAKGKAGKKVKLARVETRRIPAERTRAISVSRSAGG